MQTGIYLNAFICFLIFGFSLFAAVFIYRSNKNSHVDISYASFWFFTSFTWLFFSMSLLTFKLGYIDYSMVLNQYLVQTTVFLQGVGISYFSFFRLTKNKTIASWSVPIFIVLAIAGLYFNYQDGTVYLSKSTYYSMEYAISSTSFIIFQIMFSLVVITIGLDFLRNLYFWFRKNISFEQKYFFAALAVLIDSMIGYFEQSSTSTTWISMLFRLAIILAAHTAYLAYSDKEIL